MYNEHTAANGAHQTCPSYHTHTNICPTVVTTACILAEKKLVWVVCSQEVITCFTSASAANCLPGRCFLQYSKSITSLPTGLVSGYGAMAAGYRPSSLQSWPGTQLACGLWQTPTLSKLSPSGHTHLTPLSFMLEYKPGATVE